MCAEIPTGRFDSNGIKCCNVTSQDDSHRSELSDYVDMKVSKGVVMRDSSDKKTSTVEMSLLL